MKYVFQLKNQEKVVSDKPTKFFITDFPAFYKIKLFNEISKQIPIFIFFIFSPDQNPKRNKDFFKEQIAFGYKILGGVKLKKQISIIEQYLKQSPSSEIIIDGWDTLLAWYSALFFRMQTKSLIVESSVFECKTTGIKGWFKKFFLKFIDRVYVPGISNKKLLEKLNFKGEIVITGGVGLYNRQSHTLKKMKLNTEWVFLYVGRLSPEKNLDWIINIFNELPQFKLQIVGFGPLESYLRSIAKENIVFEGAVDNKELFHYYEKADIFVLPSKSETWGLVVEEALNVGIPVLVSNKVGCAEQVVEEGKNGCVFELNNKEDFLQKVKYLTDISNYNEMISYISTIDFGKIEKKQIQSYLR